MLLTPLMIGYGQVLFKQAAGRIGGFGGAELMRLFLDPVFIAAVALYGLATIVWVYTLSVTPLSIAYSFMALSYLIVPLFAWWLLGEAIPPRYLIGTGLILAGMVVIQS